MLGILIQPLGQDFLSDREINEVLGAMCWVVSVPALTRMKCSAGRFQDLADIERLGKAHPS